MTHKCFNGLSSCVGHGSSSSNKYETLFNLNTAGLGVYSGTVTLSNEMRDLFISGIKNRNLVFIDDSEGVLAISCTAWFDADPTYMAHIFVEGIFGIYQLEGNTLTCRMISLATAEPTADGSTTETAT